MFQITFLRYTVDPFKVQVQIFSYFWKDSLNNSFKCSVPFSFLKGLQLYSVRSLACLIFHTLFSDPFYSFLIFILLFSCLFFKCLLLDFHSNPFSPEHFIIYSLFQKWFYLFFFEIDQFPLHFFLEFCSFLFFNFWMFYSRWFLVLFSMSSGTCLRVFNSTWNITL